MADLTRNLVKAQIEYYFSDANLMTDRYFLSLLMKPNHPTWIEISDLAALPAVSKLTSQNEVVISAVQASGFIEYDAERKLCRRPDYKLSSEDIKTGMPTRDLRRTVFLYGIPIQYEKNALMSMMSVFGEIKRIHWDDAQDEEGPNVRIARIVTKHKLYQPLPMELQDTSRYPPRADGQVPWALVEDDVLNKVKCAYVVFTTQSQANKACKAYRHHSAIRSLTQYEFKKLEKKVILAEAKGERVSFNSPVQSQRSSLVNSGGSATLGGLGSMPSGGGRHSRMTGSAVGSWHSDASLGLPADVFVTPRSTGSGPRASNLNSGANEWTPQTSLKWSPQGSPSRGASSPGMMSAQYVSAGPSPGATRGRRSSADRAYEWVDGQRFPRNTGRGRRRSQSNPEPRESTGRTQFVLRRTPRNSAQAPGATMAAQRRRSNSYNRGPRSPNSFNYAQAAPNGGPRMSPTRGGPRPPPGFGPPQPGPNEWQTVQRRGSFESKARGRGRGRGHGGRGRYPPQQGQQHGQYYSGPPVNQMGQMNIGGPQQV